MVDEEISLTKDVIKRPDREAFPTFLEWVADGNAEQILRNAFKSTSGSVTLFEVPENFTFFITSFNMSSENTAGGAGNVESLLRFSTTEALARIAHNMNEHDHVVLSQSYTMPVRVPSGQVIEISNIGASLNTSVVLQGFLLPKKISIR